MGWNRVSLLYELVKPKALIYATWSREPITIIFFYPQPVAPGHYLASNLLLRAEPGEDEDPTFVDICRQAPI